MDITMDVFKADGFSTLSMTKSILKAPYKPGRLASMFPFQGINTLGVMLEEKNGLISLIPNKPRNSGSTSKRTAEKRKVRTLACCHLPLDDYVQADDVQGVRQFDTTSSLETVQTKVNEKLLGLRGDHEITHEYHRIGAIQGLVRDADGSTITDLYTEFGFSRETIDFELDDNLTDVKRKCSDVARFIQLQLGAVPFTGIECQCGDGFWDMLIQHPACRKAYERASENNYAREDQRFTGGFRMGEIFFENYRGKVGDVDFIDSTEAAFYPLNVPEMFAHYGAPANWMETVNTTGLVIYAKQVPLPDNSAVQLLSQSNPLVICRRPEVLCGGTTTVVAA